MKKKFDWRGIAVSSMIVFGILVGALSTAKYLDIVNFAVGKIGKKQLATAVVLSDLERFEQTSGDGIHEIVYVDHRGPFAKFYYDPDKDGEVDKIESKLDYPELEKTPLITFLIAETYYEAETHNGRKLRDGILDGSYWLARSSPDARELQDHYKEVREQYLKRHPKLKLQNANPLTRIRPQTIKLFKSMLEEYRLQDTQAHKAKTQRKAETAAYKAYLAFLGVNDKYRLLNEWEKRYLFNTVKNLPQGFKIDSGPEITEILGIRLTDPRDLRGNFESFLKLSYMETDYMSAWSIFKKDEITKITEQYYKELTSKGLM